MLSGRMSWFDSLSPLHHMYVSRCDAVSTDPMAILCLQFRWCTDTGWRRAVVSRRVGWIEKGTGPGREKEIWSLTHSLIGCAPCARETLTRPGRGLGVLDLIWSNLIWSDLIFAIRFDCWWVLCCTRRPLQGNYWTRRNDWGSIKERPWEEERRMKQ